MSNTIHVKGISSQTSEQEVHDFFSFCGKIQTLNLGKDGTADVTFEKEAAAKTAILLDNTQLGPSEVHVTGTASSDTTTSKSTSHSDEDLAQEDKPRSRIAAEMLAHGYVWSDVAIQRAIALDQQHGISNRFTSALQQFDSKYKATERVQAVDQQYNVTGRATDAWKGLNSYFEKAIDTPTGQKLRSFYEQGQRQVVDVHNEAKHLASLKQGKSEGTGSSATSSEKVPTAEEAEMEKVNVDGKERTKCNCGGADGKCPCEPGKCACSGCSKAS